MNHGREVCRFPNPTYSVSDPAQPLPSSIALLCLLACSGVIAVLGDGQLRPPRLGSGSFDEQ